MSQIEEANENILTRILKSDPFYEALWGKEDFTPNIVITEPNDYNCGAICNGLEYVYAFIRDITGLSLEDLPAPYIDIVIYFFSGIKRFLAETNESLMRRMESLLIRESGWRSEKFGTPWDIKNVLSYYIPRDMLYYIPNSVLTNILINGDFEDVMGAEWVLDPSGDRSSGGSFVGTYKLDFTSITSAKQTIAVTEGSYILNSFVKPTSGPPVGFASTWDAAQPDFENASYVEQDFLFSEGGTLIDGQDIDVDVFNLVIQRDSDNYYYNFETRLWAIDTYAKAYTAKKTGYTLAEFFVVVDGTYNIIIDFQKIVSFNLDRVEFGLKLYPAFEILFVDTGLATDLASMWVEGQLEYENASYLDQDFMYEGSGGGFSDLFYQDLLDEIKAAGIKAIYKREAKL